MEDRTYTQQELAELSAKINERLRRDRERSRRSYAKCKHKVTCEVCGAEILSHSMRLHVKSKKHLRALEAQG